MQVLRKSTPLWTKWNQDALLKKKAEVGQRNFARGWSQNAISDDELIFRPEHIDGSLNADYKLYFPEEMPYRDTLKSKKTQIFMGVDLAISSQANSDFFVIMVIQVNRIQNQRRIIGLYRKRNLTFHQQITSVDKWATYFDPNMIYVESNNYQMALIQELHRTTYYPVKAFTTTSIKKSDLEIGLPKLSVELETGRWILPNKDDGITRDLIGSLISELKTYPVTDNDDTLMAMWFCSVAASEMARLAKRRISVL